MLLNKCKQSDRDECKQSECIVFLKDTMKCTEPFTGWLSYIYLDSSKVWIHLQMFHQVYAGFKMLKGQYRHDQQDMESECLFSMKFPHDKVTLPLLLHKCASNFQSLGSS